MLKSLYKLITSTVNNKKKYFKLSDFPKCVQDFINEHPEYITEEGLFDAEKYSRICALGAPKEMYHTYTYDMLREEHTASDHAKKRRIELSKIEDAEYWEVVSLTSSYTRKYDFLLNKDAVIPKKKNARRDFKIIENPKQADEHAKHHAEKREEDFRKYMTRSGYAADLRKVSHLYKTKEEADKAWKERVKEAAHKSMLCDYDFTENNNDLYLNICGRSHKIRTYFYDRYLSAEDGFIHDLIAELTKPGAKCALTAPCGAGKSFVMTKIQRILTDRRQLVLCVPLAMQTSQLGQDETTWYTFEGTTRKIQSANGDGGDVASVDCAQMTAVVYDRVHDLISLDQPDNPDGNPIGKLILIIDEAHNLVSQANFRKRAIHEVEDVAARVIKAGGSVLYVTATPAKILGFNFDDIFSCVKIDEKTKKPVDQNSFKKLDIYQKNSRRSMRDALIPQTIDEVSKGYKPLIRINNKNTIESVAAALRARGLKVVTLSSDDKGYTLVNGRRYYDNQAYADLIGPRSALPYCDVFLTTSVIECGTNIKGMWSENANRTKDLPIQDPKLLPVFYVGTDRDFDLDNIAQFLARVRYGVDKAVIFMNLSSKNGDKELKFERLQSYISRRYNVASAQALAMTENGSSIQSVTETLSGARMDDAIQCAYENGMPQYVIDVPVFIAECEGEYEKNGYYSAQILSKWLKRFGENLNVRIINDVKSMAHDLPEPLTKNFKEKLRLMASDPAFQKAVIDGPKIDTMDKTVQTLKKEGGRSVMGILKKVREAAAHHGAPVEAAVEAAIASVEDPDEHYHDEKTGKTIKALAADSRMMYLAESGEIKTHEDCLQVIYYAASQMRGIWKKLPMSISENSLDASMPNFTPEYQGVVAECIGDVRFRMFIKFCLYFGLASLSATQFARNLKLFAEHDETYARIQTAAVLYRQYNMIDDVTSDRYVKTVMARKSPAGSEYNAIRRLEKIVIYRKDKDGKPIENYINGRIEKVYDHPFVGPDGKVIKNKTVDLDLCEEIAEAFHDSMTFAGGCSTKKAYTKEYIMTLFDIIYASDKTTTDSHGKISKRRIGGLRKRKSHATTASGRQVGAVFDVLDAAAAGFDSSESILAGEMAVQTLSGHFNMYKKGTAGKTIGHDVRETVRKYIPEKAKIKEMNAEIREKIDAGCNEGIKSITPSSTWVQDMREGTQCFSVSVGPNYENKSGSWVLDISGVPFSPYADERVSLDDPRIKDLITGQENAVSLFTKAFPILKGGHETWKSLNMADLKTDAVHINGEPWTSRKKLKELDVPTIRDFAEDLLQALLPDVSVSERKFVKDKVREYVTELEAQENVKPAA